MRKRRRRKLISTRKRIQAARSAGRLVDCTHIAKHSGFRFRCEVSVDLWNSLFWKYPSARDQDVIDLVEVLRSNAMRELLDAMDHPFENVRTLPRTLFVRPPNVPWWVGPRFSVKLVVLYRCEELDSVVVIPEKATLTTIYSHYQPPMPATLLLKLFLVTRRLHLIARQSERASVGCLQDTVIELLRMTPLLNEIKEYHSTLESPTMPNGLSVEEYREVLCCELYGLLGIATAVAEKSGTDYRVSACSVLRLLTSQVGMMPLPESAAIAQRMVLLQ